MIPPDLEQTAYSLLKNSEAVHVDFRAKALHVSLDQNARSKLCATFRDDNGKWRLAKVETEETIGTMTLKQTFSE